MRIPNAPTWLHKKPPTLANYRMWDFETLVDLLTSLREVEIAACGQKVI